MASGEKKDTPAKGKYTGKVFRTDPNGIVAPTPHGIMWKSTKLFNGYDHKGVETFRNVFCPYRAKASDYEVIGDLSKKINDTKEAEAEIARQKNKEAEKHKVCMQQYEDRIQKLEDQLEKISLDIKKKDADNKSAGIVQPRRSKYLDEKQQKQFVKRFVDCHLVHTDISFDALVWKGPKEKDPIEIRNKLHADRAAGRIRLGPGVRFVPDPPTQPQKRKIDEVYTHDSDEEDLVILGEWPCEKKGTAVQKNQDDSVKMYGSDDPSDESVVEKWMKTWDQFFHHGAPK